MKSTTKVVHHFSPETTAKRKTLGPLVKICNDAQAKATLIVNGKFYNLNNLHKLKEAVGIDPQATAHRQNEKRVAFNGKLSMLSNFFECSFFLDDILWSSNEQYFQYCKAMNAGKSIEAAEILSTSDPVNQKAIGGKVSLDDDQWDSHGCMKKVQ